MGDYGYLKPKYSIPKKSDKQRGIDKILHEIYSEMEHEDKVCFFCGGQATDHLHLIRRSYSRELIIHKLNIVWGCRNCHEIFDNKPKERKYLRNYDKALERIKLLDEFYYNRMVNE